MLIGKLIYTTGRVRERHLNTSFGTYHKVYLDWNAWLDLAVENKNRMADEHGAQIPKVKLGNQGLEVKPISVPWFYFQIFNTL